MWPFSSKTRLDSKGALCGFTDWHSHILPGVDDGVSVMKDSLGILARYEEMGVSEVWLTPHIMEDTPNTTQSLRSRFDELLKAYEGGIVLHLSAENMMDYLFEERLASGDILTIGDSGTHLLVEMSVMYPPLDMEGVFNRIKEKGYKPVLAHPERYPYLEKADYTRLHQMGVMFQLNLGSLMGTYGSFAKANALRLLGSQMYQLLGSDVHSFSCLEKWLKVKISAAEYNQLKKLPGI